MKVGFEIGLKLNLRLGFGFRWSLSEKSRFNPHLCGIFRLVPWPKPDLL